MESLTVRNKQQYESRMDNIKCELEKERQRLQDLMNKLSSTRKDVNMLLTLESERCELQPDPAAIKVSLLIL